MIRRRAMLAAAGAGAAALSLAPGAGAAGTGGTPGTVVDAFHAALAAGDAAAALVFLRPDALIYESGGVERSRAEYEGHHLVHDIAFAKATTRTLEARTARAVGDAAWVTSEYRVAGTVDGKAVNLVSLETMLLLVDGGRWRIAHIHWSAKRAPA